MNPHVQMLIVEDVSTDAELMEVEMRRGGLNLESTRVATEDQFVERLNKGGVDIILSDYHMPQFSAKRALHLLRQSGQDVPFIVVTGSISEEVAVEMMKMGAADYLLKDRLMRLGPAVVAALEQKRFRDERRSSEEATRKLAETQRVLLLELDHRVRNNLSSLLGLIDMSRRTAGGLEDFADSIAGRVRAMASIHGLLSDSHWSDSDLRQLISAFTPTGAGRQVQARGPEVNVPHRQVTALGMVVHELMTNSIKYGALSNPSGRVAIEWTVPNAASPKELTLEWRESGGPPAQTGSIQGEGMQLIQGLVRSELRGIADLTYPATGALHQFCITLDDAPEPQSERVKSIATRPR